MKNPFNPDHWHENDPDPLLHATLQAGQNLYRSLDPETPRAKLLSCAMDDLLVLCELCECSYCGAICCPHGDEMHFHHDGCPSCVHEEDLKAAARNAQQIPL